MKNSYLICFLFSLTAYSNVSSGETSFKQEDICKLALSHVYNKDPVIMISRKMNDNVINIQYVRANNSRLLSYDCKLQEEKVLSFDNSLNGARWYGAELGDSNLYYKDIGLNEGEKLRIRDYMNGYVSDKIFNKNEITGQPANELEIKKHLLSLHYKVKVKDIKISKGLTQSDVVVIDFYTSRKSSLLDENIPYRERYEADSEASSEWEKEICRVKIMKPLYLKGYKTVVAKLFQDGEPITVTSCSNEAS